MLAPALLKTRGRFSEHESLTWAAQQSDTKWIGEIAVDLIAPKATAQRQRLSNKPAIIKCK